MRAALRERARLVAATLPTTDLPGRETLEAAGGEVLDQLGLPGEYLGFAMVAVDNALWAARYERVPTGRRLLLLPRCLSSSTHCQAETDAAGLHCAGCGHCDLPTLQAEAERLGATVIVAEGTSAVLLKVLEGEADALLGVACLDSLEQSFNRIADLGIAHQTVPLLTDGCCDTTAELDLIRERLAAYTPAPVDPTEHTYLPLLRETFQCFAEDALPGLLDDCTGPCFPTATADTLAGTDELAREWLRRGGKRLRPFLTLATYAVGKHGAAVSRQGADLPGLVPPGVRRLAIAIEALHKASLVHDDIEDDDPYRYGAPTLHRTHGTPVAINVGDYLVGLGYRLIAGQQAELGTACVADILERLSRAHLQLCCGQGGELLWSRQGGGDLRPLQALRIASLKTAPAFFMALYTGLRAADVDFGEETLQRLAGHLGEGYQTLNDLENWSEPEENKVALGRDALLRRPTILEAFTREAGAGAALDEALRTHREDPEALVLAVGQLYLDHGAFDRAEQLLGKLRARCLDLAGQFAPPALAELLGFLVRNILRPAPPRPLRPS